MPWQIGNIMPDAIIGIKYANHGLNLAISDKIVFFHLGSQTPRNPQRVAGYCKVFSIFQDSNRNCIFPLLNSLLIKTSSFFGSG